MQSACPSKAASVWVRFVASFEEDASSRSRSQQPQSAHLGRAGSSPTVLASTPGFVLVSGGSGLGCFSAESSDCPSKILQDWFPFSETEAEEILYRAIAGQMHILLHVSFNFVPLNIRI